jgi:hypothetical protein
MSLSARRRIVKKTRSKWEGVTLAPSKLNVAAEASRVEIKNAKMMYDVGAKRHAVPTNSPTMPPISTLMQFP